ncbi:probable prolyl 4-hydroxylase 6 [Nymphaea colorata]|nr:probable prolyl 4-hydroxylase 6 [Nymphaea colorata]
MRVFFLILYFLVFCYPNVSHSLDLSGLYRSFLSTQEDSDRSYGFDPTRVSQVSWRPRAFYYKGFLSDEECDHLIYLAKGRLHHSMVADQKSGESYKSYVRTSSGFFLQKGQDATVRRIENRIATWTFLPKENGESIHVLHYAVGEKYDAHFDYFKDEKNLARGGHRMATVLMYLSDVVKGGETFFPNAEGIDQHKDDSWSDCSKGSFAVKPKKGDAVLFFSLHPDATTDTASLHGSCPVIEGEKWAATCWIHVRNFNSVKDTKEESIEGEEDLILVEESSTGEGTWGKRKCNRSHSCMGKTAKRKCPKNQSYMVEFCGDRCKMCKAH